MAEFTPIRVLVGLGNPGRQYAGTRHNAGCDFVDRLAASQGLSAGDWKSKAQSEIAEIRVAGRPLLLAKPQTYMNLSGNAVLALMAATRAKPAEILVVCDEISFEPGRMRFRANGSHGGHNGLRSIVGAIGDRFPRIRLGVGDNPAGRDLADHVLSRFSKEERAAFDALVDRAPEIVELLQTSGPEAVMNRWNGAPSSK